MEKRIEWIDVLKGLGIFLVVLGHAPALHIRLYIFSFHMPLFFFISGFLFTIDRYSGIVNFLYKKVVSLLLPYVIFSVISIVSISFLLDMNVTIKQYVWEALKSIRNQISYNQSLWFLTSLFVIEVVYFFGLKYIKNPIVLLSSSFLISYLGYVLLEGMIKAPNLPWTMDQTIYYLLFFSIGNTIRSATIQRGWIKWIFIFGFFTNLILFVKPQFIPEIMHFIPNSKTFTFFSTTMISILGIIAFVALAKLFSNSTHLQYIGKNSIIILCLHLPIAFVVIDKVKNMMNLSVPLNDFTGILYTMLTIIILKPFIYIINTYLPFIIGKGININLRYISELKVNKHKNAPSIY